MHWKQDLILQQKRKKVRDWEFKLALNLTTDERNGTANLGELVIKGLFNNWEVKRKAHKLLNAQRAMEQDQLKSKQVEEKNTVQHPTPQHQNQETAENTNSLGQDVAKEAPQPETNANESQDTNNSPHNEQSHTQQMGPDNGNPTKECTNQDNETAKSNANSAQLPVEEPMVPEQHIHFTIPDDISVIIHLQRMNPVASGFKKKLKGKLR